MIRYIYSVVFMFNWVEIMKGYERLWWLIICTWIRFQQLWPNRHIPSSRNYPFVLDTQIKFEWCDLQINTLVVAFSFLYMWLNIFSLSVSGVWCAQALEVSVGKISFVEVMNGSSVVLPCTYSSCIGIKNLYFNWQYNDNGTMIKVRPSVSHVGDHPHRITQIFIYFYHKGDRSEKGKFCTELGFCVRCWQWPGHSRTLAPCYIWYKYLRSSLSPSEVGWVEGTAVSVFPHWSALAPCSGAVSTLPLVGGSVLLVGTLLSAVIYSSNRHYGDEWVVRIALPWYFSVHAAIREWRAVNQTCYCDRSSKNDWEKSIQRQWWVSSPHSVDLWWATADLTVLGLPQSHPKPPGELQC